MPANTDARVPNDQKESNLINVGGKDAGTSPVWRVTINGKQTFVHTRSHEDGSRSHIAIEKSPGGIERPYVLATINKDGALSTGGSGRIYYTTNFGTTQSGDIRIGAGPGGVEVTDSATAQAILATGTINGKSATQAEQLSLGYDKAKVMSNARIANDPRFVVAAPDKFVPAIQQGTDRRDRDEPFQVIPHNADDDPKVEESIASISPGNNDPSNSNGENAIVATITDGAEKLEDLAKDILPKIADIVDSLKFTEADIAKFDGLFEAGGGDKIEGGAYPIDNTYGEIRGQDYVTIDQFIYQPPRRDQILGTGKINPIENLTQGQQRLTPLKKFVAMVKLPMPNNITDSNAVSWGDDAMNNLSATLTSAVMRNPTAGLAGGLVSSLVNPTLGKMLTLGMVAADNDGIVGPNGEQLKDIDSRFKAVAKMLESSGGTTLMKANLGAGILGMLDVNVSPESLLSRGFGVIPNSNVELLFNKVTLRDFQFSWRMSPRDEREALQVKRIIRFFKQGMAAKTISNQAGERAIYLGTPNVFRLQYRTTGGRIIEGVNRIKPCAVVGTAVNYTPDGQWSAYDEGQPVSCTLSIQMKELEPVYASDYSQDVIESRRSGEIINKTATINTGIDDPTSSTTEIDTGIPAGEGDLYRIRPTEVGY